MGTAVPDRHSRRDARGAARRGFLARGFGAATLALNVPLAHAAALLAVRVWPARDYTRVTLELDAPLPFTQLLVADPPRLVVDLDGLDLDPTLRELVAKVKPDDPYIRQVRVGQFRPRVVRIVFDLKTEVSPQLFTLPPIAAYRHRLVLDLYPREPIDPLQALLAQVQSGPATGVPEDPIGALIRDRDRATTPEPARPVPPGPPVARLVTIAIDPGHGGEDPGAIGQGGTREKDVVLAIGELLRRRVNAEPNMRAYMTRDADFFVPLATRVNNARRVQADLFVSVHADAFVDRAARGASVYVLSERGASSGAARWLADRENRADLIGGVNLARRNREVAQVLLELSTTAQIKDSRNLARIVLDQLGGVGRLHKPHVEQAGFAVLKSPDVPSILVETAFISNPQEEKRLADLDYQERIADAIFAGIRRYFVRYPPAPKGRPT
ncbi:MAG: N-acetylmuramoyl-L-alanine amidase [Burkholderiaceae bacterium]